MTSSTKKNRKYSMDIITQVKNKKPVVSHCEVKKEPPEEDWLKAFRKKFTVVGGTKRIRRVGHFTCPGDEIPAAAFSDDVEAFISNLLKLERQNTVREIREMLEKQALENLPSRGGKHLGFNWWVLDLISKKYGIY